MMKRMVYKDETGYHMYMDVDEPPAKRLYDLEEERERRERSEAWVELLLEPGREGVSNRVGPPHLIMQLLTKELVTVFREMKIPGVSDYQLVEELRKLMIERMEKEDTDVLR